MKWKIIADKGDSRNWSSWYAWHPVQTEDNGMVWLETIVRKQNGRTKTWVDWLFLDFFTDYIYKESVFQILKDEE